MGRRVRKEMGLSDCLREKRIIRKDGVKEEESERGKGGNKRAVVSPSTQRLSRVIFSSG